MMIETRQYAAHTAYLAPLVGLGLFVEPLIEDDVAAIGEPQRTTITIGGEEVEALSGCDSLHMADSIDATRDLWDRGRWFIAWDCDDADWLFGPTADGRPAYVLRSDAIAGEPDEEESIDAMFELC